RSLAALGTGLVAGPLGRGDRREQGLASLLLRARLRLALRLVVALHRGLVFRQRRLDLAHHVARDLGAVVLDRGASGVGQGVALVARVRRLLVPLVRLAMSVGVPHHLLDRFAARSRTRLDLDLLFLAGRL